MIKIERSLTIPKITKLYLELNEINDSTIDIQLPKRIDNLDFGVLFSFLQFLSTWIRHERSGKIHLPISTNEEVKDYLNANEFVYPSIVLSWEKEIINEKGKDIKSDLKTPSKEYFQKMEFFELDSKLAVPVFCFDHDKSNRGLSRHFYVNEKKLAPEDTVGFNLYRAFQKIGSFNRLVFRNSIRQSLDTFNAIIHELFGNTNEHAKTNEVGYNLYPNIRAVYLKFHKRTISKYLEVYKDFAGLISYFNSGFQLNSMQELYLIEISVLDSGPGLYKRYTGKSTFDEGINEEINVIKECLYRHNTSTQGLDKEIKGIGLDRVLQAIDKKGFVRIKTGRADIFRDMKSSHYVHHEKASDIILYDWQKNSSSDFVLNPVATGTLISIFFPLDF